MALPWKKSRVSKMSRIVADLQAPSRESSLVVETGFPTSLIDLFVKNKDRFRKASSNKKKRKLHKQQELRKECVYEEELVKVVDILSGYACDSTSIQIQERDSLEQRSDRSCSCDQVVSNNSSENKRQKRVIVLLVLKLFVAMILALSTKRLAVGITMSAFVLMLLEHVGKLSCFSKLYSEVIQKVLRVFGDLIDVKHLGDEKNSSGDMLKEMKVSVLSSRGVGNVELNSSIDEIQGVESDTKTVAPVKENKIIEMDLDKGPDTAYDGRNDKIGTLISGKRESRCSRIKNKIVRKFATKKLRGGKKGKECKDKQPAGEKKVGDESTPILTQLIEEQTEEVEEDNRKVADQLIEEQTEEVEEDNRKVAAVSAKRVWRCMSGFQKRGDNEFHGEIRRSRSTGFHATMESFVVEKVVDRRKEISKRGNSGFFVLLPVILFGLMGGRILSLMVTISSCLIFACIRRNKRYVDKNTRQNRT